MARKEQTQPQGASLREAAAALGITRAALLKMIDRGLPAPLVRERRTVDIEQARAWIAAHDAEHVAPTVAAQYHPDDPRAIQAATAAKVKAHKLALEVGAMVTTESAVKIMAHALANLNSKLSALPSMVGPLTEITRDTARELIADALTQVLEDFTPDTAEQWPDSPFVPDADSDPDEFEERHYQPIMPDSDPRAAVARVQTQKLRMQLDALESTCVAVEDVRRIMREQAESVRKAVNKIPGRIATRLPTDAPAHVVRDLLAVEIDAAKHAALVALGVKPTWKPQPPQTLAEDDAGPLDEVDGDAVEEQFELT